MIDLVSERVGGEVLSFTDEFFAPAERLIRAEDPVANDEYTDRGKWMDGWETRRRREPGHDWVVIKLGIPGRIRRVTVDTSHFTGNYPEQFSLEGSGISDPEEAEWVELIPTTGLSKDALAEFGVDDLHRVELIRFNIFPDGGVARLRIEGDAIPAMPLVCSDDLVDLAVSSVGGEVIDASDLHYSHPSNMLRPVSSAGMWDGWETKRRRDDGHDWVVVELGLSGSVQRLVVDTTHFKGNAPGWVSAEVSDDRMSWTLVANRIPVSADQVNIVEMDGSAGSYLRLSIHPDGGVARLRVLGTPSPDSAVAKRVEYLDALFPQAARRFLSTACDSPRWVDAMMARRPFGSAEGVHAAAEAVFAGLTENDWLEAFAGHPRIGERGDATANREQAGAASASRETIHELSAVNRRYEDKFGFTYIVYATGKTAEQMLAIARERLGNDRRQEIGNAAGEQRQITATRLRRMLCQEV